MAKSVNHFIGPLIPINNRVVKICSLIIKFREEGIVKWEIEDGDLETYTPSSSKK